MSAVVAEGLRKVYDVRDADGRRRPFAAVAGASFTVERGGSLGIVGESGSGKTTLARMLAGLEPPSGGRLEVCGRERTGVSPGASERRRRARELQIVFQDPYTSLNPRHTVATCLDEVLRVHLDDPSRERRAERVLELLAQVGLDERHARSRPRALSGGQRQRVAIARALAASPEVIVLDEAVSALDVSIQAQILDLLDEIRARTKTTYLFISHDLGVVRQVTDELIVMRGGEIVERGATAAVLDAPRHPYTQLLRRSVPGPGWRPRRRSAERAAATNERGDHGWDA
ncbi:ABC transporter ATP-binding protein [Conexibacter arvalis]|uniref:Peptide/nickel transport system ATP-binding protein n=1 Tax=Conexibacter arvalis TaxID=912552 RepID=A0A840IJ84_9ACTN|nr:ATP-binding cassette domain-containing protein [Conexibacter arvalis]MBB4664243.1 peptide/nickel transport system ATP-binding protein [Conexibacter arvalis]